MKTQWILCFIIFFCCVLAHANTYVIAEDSKVIGEVEYIVAEGGETLGEIGRRYDIGYSEMVKANPGVDPHSLLPAHIRLTIPSQFKLPAGLRKGIIINLSQYRLFYFPGNENIVMTFPVGIGRKGWRTPLGKTRIVAKEINPVWHPSEKLRKEGEQHGMVFPEVFPANSANPLGKRVLRLGWPTYLIHGTNSAETVGSRVSAGCIRMLSADIEQLFSQVAVGTPVTVIK